MKMTFVSAKDVESKYNHEDINATLEGIIPAGAVTCGRDKNPPPIVVPAITAADFITVDVDVDVDVDASDDDNSPF